MRIFVGAAEVVAGSYPQGIGQRQVDAHDKMVDEAVAPVVEVDKRGRHSERRVLEPAACSYLNVNGNRFEVVVVGLNLSAQVLGYERERDVAVGVVVVHTQVETHAHAVVAAYVRAYELGSYSTRDAVAEHVGEVSCHGNVLGREVARLLSVGIHLAHGAVIHELSAHRPRSLVVDVAVERRACRGGTLHIGHEVKAYGLVAHRREQAGL